MISAIIMASGYANRMGKNKLLLKYKEKSLIQHTIDTVLEYDFKEVILVAREKEILEIGKKNGLKVVKNEEAIKGISESIKLGVKYADTVDGYMFFTGDQPLLDEEIIKQLVYGFRENKTYIIVPTYKGRRGSPAIFPRKFKEDFLQLEGDVGGRIIINKHLGEVRFIEIEDGKKLFDVDTKKDYEQILKWGRLKEYGK